MRLSSRGCDFLILVLGLAGATGVALAERFIELGHEAGAKVIVVGVQPFAFEGCAAPRTIHRRPSPSCARKPTASSSSRTTASRKIRPRSKNIRHGFHLMHQLMAQTAQALAQVVCKRGLIQLSFADVRSLYGRYAGSEVLENCWAAHVEGDIHDRTEDLVARTARQPRC